MPACLNATQASHESRTTPVRGLANQPMRSVHERVLARGQHHRGHPHESAAARCVLCACHRSGAPSLFRALGTLLPPEQRHSEAIGAYLSQCDVATGCRLLTFAPGASKTLPTETLDKWLETAGPYASTLPDPSPLSFFAYHHGALAGLNAAQRDAALRHCVDLPTHGVPRSRPVLCWPLGIRSPPVCSWPSCIVCSMPRSAKARSLRLIQSPQCATMVA